MKQAAEELSSAHALKEMSRAQFENWLWMSKDSKAWLGLVELVSGDSKPQWAREAPCGARGLASLAEFEPR